MARYTFVKGYMNYYVGSVEAETEEEARKFALELDGDELTSCGESEWIIDSIWKGVLRNEREN